MDDPFKIQLTNYAIKVRKACFDYAVFLNSKGDSYFEIPNLDGMCAVASGAYIEYIKKFNLSGKIVHSDYHAWVSIDNYFVDLTASQFIPCLPFFVIKRNELNKMNSKYNCRAYSNYIKGDNYTMSSWPEKQKPHKEKIRKILEFGGLT